MNRFAALRFTGLFTLLLCLTDGAHAQAKPKKAVSGDKPPVATAASELTVLPGFKVELIHSSLPGEGSWICMAVDRKGRLIISPQDDKQKLLRVTLDKHGQVEKIETIDQPVGVAMGMLYAFDSLYVNGAGPQGLGLYRLEDNHHLDKFGPPKLIKKIEGAAGEHGSHGIVLGADKHLYIVSGNFTHVPDDISPASPHKNYAEDQLLPRANDGNGFGNGIKPPGGFLLRTDKDGKKWELVAAGMRNTYDFAMNSDGELLGFDSDMEYDWGTPWYRPIRIFHLISGGDYGFREGTGKFPKYYPDSLPSVVDVGIGSPTGLKFGTGSKFPKGYQQALYALDWSYGRIFAIHFTPDGATYGGTVETFLKGKPLNVTDIEFGKDGAMYFTTGGRGTQSGLYRVSYVGPEPATTVAPPSRAELRAAAKARDLRHKIETFQGAANAKAVDFVWPYLNSDDRFIRYAARIALESQPVAEWKSRALDESQPNAAFAALLALSRVGGSESQGQLFEALGKFKFADLTREQKLDGLRVVELSFIRQGKPTEELAKGVADALDPYYPAKDEFVNRELCEVLLYLQAPDAIHKTLALLDAAPTQEEQIHYILHLRKINAGWTIDDRKHYFSWFLRQREGTKAGHPPELLKWFADADRDYSDGASFPKFISGFRRDAMENLSAEERLALGPYINDKPAETVKSSIPHKFVQDWTTADILPALDQVTKGRSFAKGKDAFIAAQCNQCHRFGNDGGAIGPELTAVSSRFGHRDILESIIEPSKVVSEQFQNTTIIKKDGDDLTGRILDENDQRVTVLVNPLTQFKVDVAKSDIAKRQPSKVSPMPEGLVNNLTKEEILDLIAYLESGGKESAPAFQPK